jgi:hypothetical protein
MPGAHSSTAYQTSGIVVVMCGSPASSGAPDAERSPDTAQLFDPVGSADRPIASRTSASCAASASPSPVQPAPGAVTTGLPPGYCGSSRAVVSAPTMRTSSARNSSASMLVENPSAITRPMARLSAGVQGSGRPRRSCSSSGGAEAAAAAAFTPAA